MKPGLQQQYVLPVRRIWKYSGSIPAHPFWVAAHSRGRTPLGVCSTRVGGRSGSGGCGGLSPSCWSSCSYCSCSCSCSRSSSRTRLQPCSASPALSSFRADKLPDRFLPKLGLESDFFLHQRVHQSSAQQHVAACSAGADCFPPRPNCQRGIFVLVQDVPTFVQKRGLMLPNVRLPPAILLLLPHRWRSGNQNTCGTISIIDKLHILDRASQYSVTLLCT